MLHRGSFNAVHPEFISGCIRALAIEENVANNKDRVLSDIVHVSSLLHDFCPRKKYLTQAFHAKMDIIQPNAITPAHLIMWGIGRSVESLVRKAVIDYSRTLEVFGKWVCPCGRDEYVGSFNKGRSCPVCERHTDIYTETELYDKSHNIMGRPDLILFDGSVHTIVEIKSTAKEQFTKLQAPLGTHILQAYLYKLLLTKNGMNVSDKVIVFYCQKEFIFGSPLKEFTVNVEDEMYKGQVDGVLSKALLYKRAIDRNCSPPRICKSAIDRKAKNCKLCNVCFAESDYDRNGVSYASRRRKI